MQENTIFSQISPNLPQNTYKKGISQKSAFNFLIRFLKNASVNTDTFHLTTRNNI